MSLLHIVPTNLHGIMAILKSIMICWLIKWLAKQKVQAVWLR